MNDAAAQLEEFPVLDTGTLFGDLRDAILQRLRAMPKPWTVMSESEQRDMIAGIERVSEHLVRGAVELIAANGQAVIRASLDSCVVKDGIKAVVTLSRHDARRHELIDGVGKSVMLVIADSEQFMDQKAPAKADPNQPGLPLEPKDNVAPLKPRE